jgi:hypothetical protein
MSNLSYTISPADVAAGSVTFTFDYTGGHSMLGDCSLLVSGSAQFQVTVVGPPACSIASPSQSVCAGGAANFTVSSTGPAAGGPFTFSWTGPNGFTATGPIINISNVQAANTGTYTATVTDQFGCTSTCTARLALNPAPTCTIAPVAPLCAGASATLNVTVTGGTSPFIIHWTGPASFTGSGASVTINNAQAASAGTYTANVTDAAGCTTSCTTTLVVNPNPTCTIAPPAPVCVGGTATLNVTVSGGTSPFNVAWTGPGTFTRTGSSVTVNNAQLTSAGTYTAHVTDAAGCTTTCTATLVVNASPTCSIAPLAPICAGASATLNVTVSGGTAPFIINWTGPGTFMGTGPSVTINNAQLANAGTYTANVTDAAGCTTRCVTTLVVNPLPSCTIAAPAPICAGASATLNVTVSGGTSPFTITWTGPASFSGTGASVTVNNAQAASAGTYTANVTDAAGCTTSCTTTLVVNPNPTCTIAPPAPVCVGGTATLNVTVSSGTGPFNIAWTGPGTFTGTGSSVTVNNAQLTSAGTYTAHVTDAAGCTTTCTATLVVNASPTCSIAPLAPICAGASATLNVTVSGGTGPFTINWTGPGTFTGTGPSVAINNAQAANAGTYTASVTDAAGCTTRCVTTLVVNPLPNCTIAAPAPICAGASATLNVMVNGGTSPLTITWTGPASFSGTGASVTVNNAQAASAGTYTASVTDAAGCTTSCTTTLVVNPNPTCNITGPNPVNCNSTGNTYTSALSVSSGTATHSWTITGSGTISGSSTGPTVTVTAAPSGSFTLTDSVSVNGCTSTCTLTVPITPCPPKICVTKAVACAPQNGVCGSGLNYGPTATGIEGTTQPNFCYQVVVSNCGQEDMNNVSVSDPEVSNLTMAAGGTFSGTLAVGQSVTFFGSRSWGASGSPHVNTVTASGTGVNSGTKVTAQATASVTVVPINLTCDIVLSSSFDLDNHPTDNHVTLPTDQQNAPISITVSLHNSSSVDLQATLSGLPDLLDCTAQTPVAPPQPVTITAGSDMTLNVGCILASCPTNANFTVSVMGTAEAGQGVNCIYDAQGNAISAAASTCSATVTCQPPASCRLTGGGVLLPGEVEVGTCSPNIVTTVFGPTCGGADAVKITHGGQLGAPYSNPTCGTVAQLPQGDPCIRGQWEHVRHYGGKGNQQSSFEVDNFHSNTPMGIFDSVMCACLPCCENPAAGGRVGQLCNPDDHQICGPEPRPAPANAIIFSGIGYIKTCSDSSANANGKGSGKSQAVIFRVYIEDRSEPGGQHPGGAQAPADVYCFQAWSLGTINGNNGGKIDSAAAITARQAVASDSCAFIKAYTQGALPNANVLGTPLINDCGALHTGNQQIHPSTGATCP